MASLLQPFQDVINELGRGMMRPIGMASQAFTRIRLDVDEDPQAYTVRAEIAGARKEDIQVSVEGNQVTLSAELRPETPTGSSQRTVYTERSYGLASRSFTLPEQVDGPSASAQYRDGVLTLVLPKKAGSAGQRVPVS